MCTPPYLFVKGHIRQEQNQGQFSCHFPPLRSWPSAELERMHGSIREREKVIRGLKVDDTPIIPMNQIYYNFIRGHQALDGKTPAEMAGVGIGDENKWLALLKSSISKE